MQIKIMQSIIYLILGAVIFLFGYISGSIINKKNKTYDKRN